jgi:DNA (cytosine-5)-methyltransferase 1
MPAGAAGAMSHDSSTCASCADDKRELARVGRPAFEEGPDPVVVVDLFCGCGGMSLGVADAAHRARRGFKSVLAVDFDPAASAIYQLNFPEAGVEAAGVEQFFDGEFRGPSSATEAAARRRIHLAAPAGVDFLIGGPPCQGHSDLNNRSRRADGRNELYLRMLRAAEILDPRVVLIENVPAVRHAVQAVVQTTQRGLETLGYNVDQRVFDVSGLGVPQTRKRHLLLATKPPVNAVDVLSHASARGCVGRSVGWAIHDLDGCYGSNAFHTSSTPSTVNRARMEWFFRQPGEVYDLPNELRPPCHRDKEHSYKSVYGRLRWEQPAQTITTGFTSMGQGRYVHPRHPRTITPHEAARLQGFPDYFRFGEDGRSVWSKLIGNAVPPPLSRAIAGEVLSRWKVAVSASSAAK